MSADEVHDVGAGLEGVLAISGEDLPRTRFLRDDAHIVLALDLLNGLAALQVSGNIAGVTLATSGGVGVGLDDVGSGRRHAHGQILNLINGLVDAVRGTDDDQLVRVDAIRREDDRAASLSQEVVDRRSHVTNNELVPVALNLNVLHGELALKLSNLAVELSPHLCDCLTLTGKLNRVAGLGSERRRAAVGRDLRCLLGKVLVLGNLHAKVTTLLHGRQTLVAGSSQEWVVLGGNVLQTSAGGGSVLVDNLLNVLLGHLDREWVALDLNINSLVQVVVLENLSSLLAGDVDLSAGALGDGLDGSTLLTNNSAANGGRNGERDVLSGANLVGDLLERNPDSICRSGALEQKTTVGSALHLNLGLAPLVDVPDDLRDGLLQLVSRLEHVGVQDDALGLATGKAHLGLPALRRNSRARSLDTRVGRGSARSAIAGERDVQAIGGTVGSLADGGRLARPHGRGSRSRGLGTAKSREEFLGLGVKLVLALACRLLAGGFGGNVGIRSRGVGAGGVGGDGQRGCSGGHGVRSILVGDFFDLSQALSVHLDCHIPKRINNLR